MSHASEAVERYLRERPMFEAFADDVASRMKKILLACEVRGEIHARAKDVSSFRGKILRKHYSDPWAQITDKAGVRVVVQLPSQVNAVVEAITKSTELESGDPTRVAPEGPKCADGSGADDADPTRLGYTGTHVQVKVPTGEHPEYECEVQVRTRSQDLWSAMSHEYLYKPVIELPTEHRRALYRLSALTEIVDVEVERAQEFLSQDRVNVLARLLSYQWIGLGLPVGDGQLTQFVVSSLVPSADAADGLMTKVRAHFAVHAEDVLKMHSTYGADQGGYLLENTIFDQPELILVRVLLAEGRLSLGRAWAEAGLPPEWLNAVAVRFGSGELAIQ